MQWPRMTKRLYSSPDVIRRGNEVIESHRPRSVALDHLRASVWQVVRAVWTARTICLICVRHPSQYTGRPDRTSPPSCYRSCENFQTSITFTSSHFPFVHLSFDEQMKSAKISRFHHRWRRISRGNHRATSLREPASAPEETPNLKWRSGLKHAYVAVEYCYRQPRGFRGQVAVLLHNLEESKQWTQHDKSCTVYHSRQSCIVITGILGSSWTAFQRFGAAKGPSEPIAAVQYFGNDGDVFHLLAKWSARCPSLASGPP